MIMRFSPSAFSAYPSSMRTFGFGARRASAPELIIEMSQTKTFAWSILLDRFGNLRGPHYTNGITIDHWFDLDGIVVPDRLCGLLKSIFNERSVRFVGEIGLPRIKDETSSCCQNTLHCYLIWRMCLHKYHGHIPLNFRFHDH